jgi:thiamine biosynthesis lipoprotein
MAIVRRARPLLGTLVEIGVPATAFAEAGRAVDAAFARIARVQSRLSRFDPRSDIGRFNAASARASLAIDDDTAAVLTAAATLRDESNGLFDVTLGTGAKGWRVEARALVKLAEGVRIDLGGIGKGFAVDTAVETLVACGVEAGWVNAGGDLRAFGALAVPIALRDERRGGASRFATIEDGAFATSRQRDPRGVWRHASVAAPTCLWADALTKVVIAGGDPGAALLARFGACAWLHGDAELAAA